MRSEGGLGSCLCFVPYDQERRIAIVWGDIADRFCIEHCGRHILRPVIRVFGILGREERFERRETQSCVEGSHGPGKPKLEMANSCSHPTDVALGMSGCCMIHRCMSRQRLF